LKKRSKFSLVNQKETEETLPSASVYNDGLPERNSGEHIDAFEARLKAHHDSIRDRMDYMCSNHRSSILVAFIRHVSAGNPPSTFCYRDSEGLAICDYSLIQSWKKDRVPEYLALSSQIDIAIKQCEARWVEHMGNMASGKAGGNIKALEMYMARFFSWDVDMSGHEEAQAACEMFRSMAAKFNKEEVIDLL
jgi:hypothetical protein